MHLISCMFLASCVAANTNIVVDLCLLNELNSIEHIYKTNIKSNTENLGKDINSMF